MGSATCTLPMVDRRIISQGLNLTHDQQTSLCSPITEYEIKNALFGMDEAKAPGMHGYYVYFYKKAWVVIG